MTYYNNIFSSDSKVYEYYKVIWTLKCDPNLKITDIKDIKVIDDSGCQLNLEAKTKASCPIANFYTIWKFLNNYNYITIPVIILIGIFQLFLGLRMFKVTVFIICVITITIFLFILFFQIILHNGAKSYIIWIVLSISVIAGILFGILISSYRKLLFIIMGGLIGYILSSLIYGLVLRYVKSNPDIVYWITTVLCILVFCIIGYFFKKLIVVFGTTIIGSYLIVRGLSLIIGGYPSESIIIDLIKNHETEQIKEFLNYKIYIYAVLFVILSVIGIFVQYKITKGFEFDEEENKEIVLSYQEEYGLKRPLYLD